MNKEANKSVCLNINPVALRTAGTHRVLALLSAIGLWVILFRYMGHLYNFQFHRGRQILWIPTIFLDNKTLPD